MATSTTTTTRPGKMTTLTADQTRRLQAAAIEAKASAYCPYSHFRVGAALLGTDGSITTGANIENASYPVGTCAERVAVGRAVMEGRRQFCALAVATDVSPPSSPCGMCRQFLREFCSIDMPVLMLGGGGNDDDDDDDDDDDGNDGNECVVRTMGELLPMSFGPENLKPRPDGSQPWGLRSAVDSQVKDE